MELTPDLMIALMTIQLHGGTGVPNTTPAVKALKKPIDSATKQGLLALESHREPHPTRKGRTGSPSMVTVKRYRVTEKGLSLLRSSGEEWVRELSQGVTLNSIQDGLRKELASLREEVLDKLESGLDRVRGLMESARGAAVPERAGGSTPDHRSETPMAAAIATSYRDLCHRVEFEDGLIDIPRLFHKTRQTLPELELEQFKRELIRLRETSGLQLKIINEVHRLSEPDRAMAIPHRDALLFYVYWPEERPR